MKKSKKSPVSELAKACLSGAINDPSYDSSKFERMAEAENKAHAERVDYWNRRGVKSV